MAREEDDGRATGPELRLTVNVKEAIEDNMV